MPEEFGFIEKKITDFEKKVLIGYGDLIFQIKIYLPYHGSKFKSVIMMRDDISYEIEGLVAILEKEYAVAVISPNAIDLGSVDQKDLILLEIKNVCDYLSSFEVFDNESIYLLTDSEELKLASQSENRIKLINSI